jgi:hypothetical protein
MLRRMDSAMQAMTTACMIKSLAAKYFTALMVTNLILTYCKLPLLLYRVD